MRVLYCVRLKACRILQGNIWKKGENNLAMMRYVLEMAKDLGVGLVKIFAAWPGLINDEEDIALYGQFERGNYYKRLWPAELRKWNHCVDGIREVADMASDMGITLALQNHAPVLSKGYEDTLTMMHEIDRRNVKLCIDAPLFYERQSDEYIREAVEKCHGQIVHSHYGAWNFSQKKNGEIIQDPSPSTGDLINYQAFIEALYHAGYAWISHIRILFAGDQKSSAGRHRRSGSCYAYFPSIHETTGTAGRVGLADYL